MNFMKASRSIQNSVCAIALLQIFMSCSSKKDNDHPAQDTSIRYAKGFTVRWDGNNKWVDITYPYQNAKNGYHYLLIPKGEKVPEHKPDVQVIEVPIQNIVCTSTTHIPLLDYLDETHKLIGFPTTDYISSEKMRARIDSGKVIDLGIDKGMNLEKLFALHPSVVMGYTMSADLGQLKKIQELGIPVVINAEYLERHPLGRAEWIKFVSLFFNKEKEADSIFSVIETEYQATQKMAAGLPVKPSVMSGIVYGNSWFLPGGKNYAARLFQDAHCHYLWENDSTNGFLQLNFESVYATAKDADFWIGVGSFKTLNEIKQAEERYALFQPLQKKTIYTYDARHGAKGGSEFLELGYLRPDIILKDLVKIAHPELLPQHELYFHKRVE